MAKAFAASGLAAVMLTRILGRQDSSGRLSGAYTYDPNDIALIAVVTLPLVIWWILESRGIIRVLLLVSLPLMLDTIFKTDSRSGALGLAAVVLGLFLTLRRRGMPKRVAWMPKAIVAAGVVTVIMLPADYRARLSSISSEDDYNRYSKTGRIEIWKRGMRYALANPVFGVGIDNFNTAEGHLSGLREPGRGFKWSTAHNSFVLVFAELGIPAGLLYIGLILQSIRTLSFGRIRGPPDAALFEALVGICWMGFVVSGFFLSFSYYDIVYVLFGLTAAVMLGRESTVPPPHAIRSRTGHRRWAGAQPVRDVSPSRG
jgi:O-antigen ligase